MALDDDGSPGYYDLVRPCYTVFHKDTETFSCLWTAYTPDYESFCAAWENDMAVYGNLPAVSSVRYAKEYVPGVHAAVVRVRGIQSESAKRLRLPAAHFYDGQVLRGKRKSFTASGSAGASCLCDGFHLCRFIRELQELLDVWGEQAEQNA